jgi:hypothetical protein
VAGDIKPYRFTVEEGMFIETRQMLLDLEPEAVYRAYMGIGGTRGWMYMDWAFAMRGWMDKVVGGVGLRRGRRHPDELRVGEALDYWRVEEIEPDRRLMLRAEMKLPGKAWFEFSPIRIRTGREKRCSHSRHILHRAGSSDFSTGMPFGFRIVSYSMV